MGFIQVLDVRADDVDQIKKANEEYRAATEGKTTIRREVVGRDRNDPSHYVVLVFFDSYEAAMENSALPETQASAEKFAALTNSISFVDLDIIEDH